MTTKTHQCELCIGLSQRAHDYCAQLHLSAFDGLIESMRAEGMTPGQALDTASEVFHRVVGEGLAKGVMPTPTIMDREYAREAAHAAAQAAAREAARIAAEAAAYVPVVPSEPVPNYLLAFYVTCAVCLTGLLIVLF